MKRILLTLSVLLGYLISAQGQEKLIISEVADPQNIANAKFVEIYNTGSVAIDFGTEIYYLARQANGGSWGNILLTGTIAPFSTYVLANNTTDFGTAYPGVTANIYNTIISGNGDDGYFLYKGGNNEAGTLVDAYGVINEDGTGKPWEYTDSRALRNSSISAPNSTWTASEWTITAAANTSIFTPGTHIFDGAPNTNLSDLKVDGTTITGFAAGILNYVYNLPAGTTTIPVVTAVADGVGATVAVTPATNLAGAKADRTTSVEVTASDGTTKKTYTVRFDPLLEFSSIAALRSGATEYDRLHKLTSEAVLTAQKVETTRNTYFIQDNTAAIRIDDPTPVKINAEYNLGDGITGLMGTFSLYGGMLQFVPVEDAGAASSTGNVIIPQKITIAEFKTNIASYDAELVMFEDITFTDAGGTFADKANYNISNGGETTVLRTEFPGIFTGNTIPTMANVTGVAIVFNSTAQIAPRILEDIGFATDVSVAGASAIKVYPVPVGSVLNIEGIDLFTGIEIRDIAGKVYYSVSNNDTWSVRIETGNLPKGVYFIKLTSAKGNVTKKFVKN